MSRSELKIPDTIRDWHQLYLENDLRPGIVKAYIE